MAKNKILELREKFPDLKKEIDNLDEAYEGLKDYFASLLTKGWFSAKDLFFQSVVNRTNQCISSSLHCMINDLPIPLLNNLRLMIEIYATNEYILEDKNNFDKAFSGKKGHEDESLRLPNAKTLVEKLKKKEPLIVAVYDDYSEVCHPNSKSVFSAFMPKKKDEEGFTFTMSSEGRILDKEQAYHIIRNMSGTANRILLTSKAINPLEQYVTFEEFTKGLRK